MKEKIFIQRNIEKWKRVQMELDSSTSLSPDALADAYLDITSDLAYAQTHYPESKTTESLNDLAFKMHNMIYRGKNSGLHKFMDIWTHDLPKTIYEARHSLLFSLIAFSVFVIFGVVSQMNDPDYSRMILGDSYVNMTLENIEKGTPTHVYSTDTEVTSFIQITFNNLLVDIRTFIFGIFTSLGTIVILFYNGIMLGSFQTFFFQHGAGWESVLAIWQHGALEIPAMILSGGAGITLGNGWLFPKTYSRLEAFKKSAKKGLKILLGVVPITIVAGFIEGFVTRHTELPNSIRIATIVIEFTFILFYFVLLPMKFRNRKD